MSIDNLDHPFINRHLIGVIRDISDEQPEKAMPILQDALAKLRVSVDGFSRDEADHWVEVTTESINMFSGVTCMRRDDT
jgi:hypothetical protein